MRKRRDYIEIVVLGNVQKSHIALILLENINTLLIINAYRYLLLILKQYIMFLLILRFRTDGKHRARSVTTAQHINPPVSSLSVFRYTNHRSLYCVGVLVYTRF